MKKIFVSLAIFASATVAVATELVVPYNPGGVMDFFGRAVQKSVIERTNDSVVVINKPGAEAALGIKYVLQQPENTNTVLVIGTGILMRSVLYTEPAFDPTEFEIIAPIAKAPSSFVVSMKSGINDFDEFIRVSKTRPLNCGTSNSASSFVAQYMFKKLNLQNVSVIMFKGSNDVALQLIGGHIDCAIDPLPMYLSYFKEDKVKIIALSDNHSDSILKSIPLFEKYATGSSFTHWYGVAIPKKSQAYANKSLRDAMRNAFRDESFVKLMNNDNFSVTKPEGNGEKFFEDELKKYDKIRSSVGIQKIQ